ncbi:TetR/AcrR family transcriptional regulator [Flexivirga sp. ID2601S]|uniref:TetR/AcrR family transcriptional regulator n=1 Tax=Flexivirga aerilata TaxID=1656889 RepID=A0A849AE69_9MICO|nr:TetR/AcrR family transcriptional regulator [Flexivirga aerilata]NNG37866.1 TetR/AcrR family transcriptional regulator [Flexivirga aerilata]
MVSPRNTSPRSASRGGARAGGERAAVLEAAAKLFESQGYSRTTMDEIARSAGVSAQAIRAHGPKVALLGAAFFARFMGREQERALASFEMAPFDCFDEPSIARILRPLIDGIAASVGVFRAIEVAAASDPEVAALLTDLRFAHRTDMLLMLAQHPALSARRRQGVADVLILTVSHAGYDHLVLRCGWSRDRFRRWSAAQIVTSVEAVLPQPTVKDGR